VDKEFVKTLARWQKAAEQGSVQAQEQLGEIYYFGLYGMHRDYGASLRWYQKAAAQDSITAQVRLGNLYFRGWGTRVNRDAAYKWYRKAAIRGLPYAQFQLGICYLTELFFGTSTAESKKQAYLWLSLGARNGKPHWRHGWIPYFAGLFLRKRERAELSNRVQTWPDVTQLLQHAPELLEDDRADVERMR
jgi:TPR repeat protein